MTRAWPSGMSRISSARSAVRSVTVTLLPVAVLAASRVAETSVTSVSPTRAENLSSAFSSCSLLRIREQLRLARICRPSSSPQRAWICATDWCGAATHRRRNVRVGCDSQCVDHRFRGVAGRETDVDADVPGYFDSVSAVNGVGAALGITSPQPQP